MVLLFGVAGCVGSGELAPVNGVVPDPDDDDALDDTGTLSATGDTALPTVPEPIAECSGLPGAPGDTAPVVLVFHGYTMSAAIMADITTWSAVADREGFVVVYADGDTGLGGPWNVGQGSAAPGCS